MLSPSRAQLLSGLHSFTRQNRFVHFRAGPRELPTSAWHPQSRPYEGNFLLAVWARGPRVGIWQRRARVRDTPGHIELLKLDSLPDSLWYLIKLRLTILPALDHAEAHFARPHQERTNLEASIHPGRERMPPPGWGRCHGPHAHFL